MLNSKTSPAVIEPARRPSRSYVPPPLRREASQVIASPPVGTPRQSMPTRWPRPAAATPRTNMPPVRAAAQQEAAPPAMQTANFTHLQGAAPSAALPQEPPAMQTANFTHLQGAAPSAALPQEPPAMQTANFTHLQGAAPSAALPQEPPAMQTANFTHLQEAVPSAALPQVPPAMQTANFTHLQEAASSTALPQEPPGYVVVEEEGYGEKREVLGPVRRALVGSSAPGDSWLATTQSLARWVREATPPRPLWAKGCGAWGHFVSAGELGAITGAEFLGAPGRTTQALVRFSMMSGRPGSPDTIRDIRGMAVKLYTAHGNLDLLTQSLPVFLVSRGSLLPQLARALGPDPRTGLGDRARFWDFCARHPETLHALTYLYTVWGIGGSYRTMAGYSSLTHLLRGADGRQWFARFAWLPRLGHQTLAPEEARVLAWRDPDTATRDLWNHLAGGGQVLYDLAVQLMDPSVGDHLEFCPLDATALWPSDRFPLRVVGTLILTHNPENHAAQVEQAAFDPGNLVPGVALSGDPLLDAAAFAIGDSNRHRLGLGGLEQPVNSSAAPAAPEAGPTNSPGQVMTGADPYAQAGVRFRAMDQGEQFLLAGNMAAELAACPPQTVQLLLEQLYAACPQWAMTVWELLQGPASPMPGVG